MSWLNTPVQSSAFRGTSFVLDRATWAPINSQNTAVHRSVIPSYYFVRMGATVAGMKIDRYGDIFSGYFSQACVRALGNSVRVGSPIATHARNSHNYLHDATQEMACICVLEDLLHLAARSVVERRRTMRRTLLFAGRAAWNALSRSSAGLFGLAETRAFFPAGAPG